MEDGGKKWQIAFFLTLALGLLLGLENIRIRDAVKANEVRYQAFLSLRRNGVALGEVIEPGTVSLFSFRDRYIGCAEIHAGNLAPLLSQTSN